jgi:hypothetical protein
MDATGNKVKALDKKVEDLERQLDEARTAAEKARKEGAYHYGVWERLVGEARCLHKTTLRAYARKLEVEEKVKVGKEAGKTYQIYKKPGDDVVDRGSAVMRAVFGPPMTTTVLEHEAWVAYEEANKHYKTACEKANAYRRKYAVWDSKDVKPVEFSGF